MTSGVRHTLDEWESVREVFSNLYQNQKKPLKDVRETLSQEYGFFATERQYKRRIRLWKLDKNKKETEMRFLAGKAAKRLAAGKQSAFRIRNQDVSQDEVNRYLKRKKICEGLEDTQDPSGISTPSDIAYYTPKQSTPSLSVSHPPTPSTVEDRSPDKHSQNPAIIACLEVSKYKELSSNGSTSLSSGPSNPVLLPNLRQPANFRSIELVISGTKDFYLSILHVDVDQVQVRHQSFMWNMRQFYELARSVSTQMAAKKWNFAQEQYGQTLDIISPILRDQNPILPVCILQVCCRFIQDGQCNVLFYLLRFLGEMAASMYSKSHSLYLLCCGLLQSPSLLPDLVTTALKQAVDILDEKLGNDHPQTMGAARGLCTALMCKGKFADALAFFTPRAERQAQTYSEDYVNMIDAFNRIIFCHFGMGNLHEAGKTMAKMTQLVDKLEDSELKPRIMYSYLPAKGELLRLQRDPSAELVLSEALECAKRSDLLRRRWAVIYARTHLNYAQESLRLDTAVVYKEVLGMYMT